MTWWESLLDDDTHGPRSPVRVALPEDEAGVLAMLRLMHAEGGMRDADGRPFPLCEAMVSDTVRRGVARGHCGVIGKPGGEVEASICLDAGHPWYSKKEFLGDYWCFVRPEFRRTSHAHALWAWAKALAAQHQMPLSLGIVSAERTAAKDRLLERHIGAKRYGSTFLYHPPGGAL